MSEQTLLPCPFCGTPPRRETFLETQSVDACRIHKIVCIQCGVASVTRVGSWFDDGVEDKKESQKVEDEAFAAWNRRAALSPAVAQPVAPAEPTLPMLDAAMRWMRANENVVIVTASREYYAATEIYKAMLAATELKEKP